MKLVELLARELDVWPDHAEWIVQEGDNELYSARGVKPVYSGMLSWRDRDCGDGEYFQQTDPETLAEDWKTAIITRADWQAERERIAGGWIAWGGGECPVDKGTCVDAMFRNNEIAMNCAAGTRKSDHNSMCAQIWTHSDHRGDIIAYRLHTPEQQQPQQEQEEMTPAHTEYNPIHTRNRILEIDRTTEALEEERVQLVQRLADEGFVLARVDGKVAQSEPAEWKVGDLLEITGEEEGHEFEIGQIVVITRIDDNDDLMPYYCLPAVGDGEPWFVNSNEAKFHYRPTA